MKTEIIVNLPEDLNIPSFMQGFIFAINEFSPIAVNRYTVLDHVPAATRGNLPDVTFVERDGRTFIVEECTTHGRHEIEILVISIEGRISNKFTKYLDMFMRAAKDAGSNFADDSADWRHHGFTFTGTPKRYEA